MSESIEKFLNILSPDNKVVFRSITKEGKASTVSGTYAFSNKESNIYFLGGLREGATRMTDRDIESINYIRLDIDIKKGAKEFLGEDMSEEDIMGTIDGIKNVLLENDFLKDISYIVFSGGGCHIYYSNIKGVPIGDGEDEVTPKVWQLAMKRIYNLYNETIEEEWLYADQAVCNTARIMRLPGTINQKNGAECKIIYEDPDIQSPLLGHVKALGLKALEESKALSQERLLEIQAMRERLIADGGGDTDLHYQLINKMPAYIIAQVLLPQFKYDGKKNFKDSGKLKGYYYVEETNSICNGGSHEFSWGETESCWSNFSLVSKHLGLSNAQTFKFYEDNFNL